MHERLGPENASPSQVSVTPDPDAARTWRAWRRGVFYAVSAVFVLGGLNAIRIHNNLGFQIAGGALVALGAPGLFLILRGGVRRVRAACRLRRGRCMHCGYSIDALASGRCPECGRDPFELP